MIVWMVIVPMCLTAQTTAGPYRFDESNNCGPLALQACAEYLGLHVASGQVERAVGRAEMAPCSMAALQRGAKSLGLHGFAARWSGDCPISPSAPAIICISKSGREKHFLAIVAQSAGRALVVDAPHKPAWIETAKLRDDYHWDGYALHVAMDADALKPLCAVIERRSSSDVFFARGIAVLLGLLLVLSPFVRHRRSRRARWGLAGRRGRQARRGFSLPELLVIIGVIAFLAALLLPAVQTSRENARRATCVHRLHQLGAACQTYVSALGTLPPTTSGINGIIAQSQSTSPHVHILSFLEQTPVWSSFNFAELGYDTLGQPPTSKYNAALLAVRIEVFVCPSDHPVEGGNSYRGNLGVGPGQHSPQAASSGGDIANGSGAFVPWRGVKTSEIIDGLSNTALFSEKLVGDGKQDVYSPWRDFFIWSGPQIMTVTDAELACAAPPSLTPPHDSYGGSTWMFGDYRQTWYNHIRAPNSPLPDCGGSRSGGGAGAYTARSSHPGGVNLALCDGSVRFVGEEIALPVWRAAATRANGESFPMHSP